MTWLQHLSSGVSKKDLSIFLGKELNKTIEYNNHGLNITNDGISDILKNPKLTPLAPKLEEIKDLIAETKSARCKQISKMAEQIIELMNDPQYLEFSSRIFNLYMTSTVLPQLLYNPERASIYAADHPRDNQLIGMTGTVHNAKALSKNKDLPINETIKSPHMTDGEVYRRLRCIEEKIRFSIFQVLILITIQLNGL